MGDISGSDPSDAEGGVPEHWEPATIAADAPKKRNACKSTTLSRASLLLESRRLSVKFVNATEQDD